MKRLYVLQLESPALGWIDYGEPVRRIENLDGLKQEVRKHRQGLFRIVSRTITDEVIEIEDTGEETQT